MHHGEDGLILEDPTDARALSEMLVRLYEDTAWRDKLGKAATVTAGQYTWERNARELGEILNSMLDTR
jgi:glycosyltransferase involved in cell wall biosynthesis